MASPRPSVWVSLARLSTAASTGPMQGVHPKANAMPIRGAAHSPSRDGATCQRRSRMSQAGRSNPAKTRPAQMITTPATWLRRRWWDWSVWPSPDAVASRAANTAVKPATNSSVERRSRRWLGRVVTASSALLTPDIIER